GNGRQGAHDAMVPLEFEEVPRGQNYFLILGDLVLVAARSTIHRVKDTPIHTVRDHNSALRKSTQRERKLAEPLRYGDDASGTPERPRHESLSCGITRVDNLRPPDGDRERNP